MRASGPERRCPAVVLKGVDWRELRKTEEHYHHAPNVIAVSNLDQQVTPSQSLTESWLNGFDSRLVHQTCFFGFGRL